VGARGRRTRRASGGSRRAPRKKGPTRSAGPFPARPESRADAQGRMDSLRMRPRADPEGSYRDVAESQ